MTPRMPSLVRETFDAYPGEQRWALLQIRELIFTVGAATEGVGPIVETLKWAQPSYASEAPRSGTPIRLGRFGESSIAVLVHCQTTLIATFRDVYPGLDYDKNRAIILPAREPAPIDALSLFVELALTYKSDRRR